MVFLQEKGLVPARPQACGQQVTGPVVVGGVEAVGPVAPAPVVPPVPFVEGDTDVFQEIGGPAAAEGRQCRFGHDGVPFGEGDPGIDGPPGDIGQIADQVAKGLEGPAAAELELGGMPGLMGGEVEHPGHRIRVGRVAEAVEFHPARRPHDHPVAVGREGVQDDRHGLPAQFRGRIAEGKADARILPLQAQRIGPCQRIGSARVDQTVVVGTDFRPADGTGVGASGIELPPGRQRGEQKTAEQDPGVPFHTTNLRKNCYL